MSRSARVGVQLPAFAHRLLFWLFISLSQPGSACKGQVQRHTENGQQCTGIADRAWQGDLISATSCSHTERATSCDTPILWSPQLNPLRQMGTKQKRGREAQPDPLSQVETSKVISNPDKLYSTLLWELCPYVYDEETALHAAANYFHLTSSFGNAHMWDCANNLFTQYFHVFTGSLFRSFLIRHHWKLHHLPTVFGVLSICEEQIRGIIKIPQKQGLLFNLN